MATITAVSDTRLLSCRVLKLRCVAMLFNVDHVQSLKHMHLCHVNILILLLFNYLLVSRHWVTLATILNLHIDYLFALVKERPTALGLAHCIWMVVLLGELVGAFGTVRVVGVLFDNRRFGRFLRELSRNFLYSLLQTLCKDHLDLFCLHRRLLSKSK